MNHKKISIRDKTNKDYEKISFPEREHTSLQKRLDDGESIYSTRVKEEKNEYSSGEILDSPFGLLKVVKVKTFKAKEKHPFEKELTDKQKKDLKGKAFDLIEFVSTSNNNN